MTDPITVFTARRIHTMDPSLPEATISPEHSGHGSGRGCWFTMKSQSGYLEQP